MPAKSCPLMSGPSGRGGASVVDCTGLCALYDHEEGACALLAIAGAVRRSAGGADRDALLALADEMDGWGGGEVVGGIPGLWADTIREALGVVEP